MKPTSPTVRLFLTALVLLFTTACGGWEKGSGHYRVYLDGSFSDRHVEIVKMAVDAWNVAVEGEIEFRYVTDADSEENLIVISPSSIAALSEEYAEHDGDTVLGYTTPDGTSSSCELAEDLDEVLFYMVAQHEIGHAIGMHHSDPGTIMYRSHADQARSVTCQDVEQFCNVWGCRADRMAICR